MTVNYAQLDKEAGIGLDFEALDKEVGLDFAALDVEAGLAGLEPVQDFDSTVEPFEAVADPSAPPVPAPVVPYEQPQLIAGREPNIFDRAREFITEKTGLFAPKIGFIGREKFREEEKLKTIGRAAVHHTAETISGLGLRIPDILANKITGEDTLAAALDKLTGFVPDPHDVRAGEAAKFIGELKTIGSGVGRVVTKIPARQTLQIILSTGLTFGTRALNEEVAKKITNNDPINWRGIHFESGVGVLFGIGEVGIIGFAKFIKGFKKLPAGQVAPARTEVNAALKHFKATGDRTRWDAVRVKYAGITPAGVERIRARAAPPPPVKDFGRHPLAVRTVPVTTPVKAVVPTVRAITPTEGIKVPAVAEKGLKITKAPAISQIGRTGIDSGRIKVTMDAPGAKPQSSGEIIHFMEKAFKIPIRGKATFKKPQALGWFDPKATGIRLKDVRALTTATHEIAHHIDWTLNDKQLSHNPPTPAIAAELQSLGEALYGKKKPVGGYKSEGFAEFVREYLTGEEAKVKAPNTYKWFTETFLPANKGIANNLAKTKVMIDRWRLQGAEARVESQISKKADKGSLVERTEKGLLWVEKGFRTEFAPIQRGLKRIGIKEGELRPSQDPYQIAVARADKAGAVASQFVLEYTTDLSGNETGKGLREVLKPVAKDINAFTRWIVAARARLLHKKGINPGISEADANFIYEKYDSEVWRDTLKEITEWNNRVMDYLVEAGGLEKKTADIIKAANPIYIPFMRAFKEGELRIPGGIGKGVAKVTKAFKRIKGSGREIIDPLESMIKQANKVISVAHKAEIAKALAGLAERPGAAAMIWKVPAPQKATKFKAEQLKKDIAKIAFERMGLDPKQISAATSEHWDEILTVYGNAGQYYGKDNIVALVVDGKQQFFEVEPNLYKAIEGIDRFTLPWFWDIVFGKATRAVRLGATGLNPAFGLIRNFLRDAATFTVLSKHAKLGPISAVKGIAEDIANTQNAKQFKALGGKMSSQLLADRRSLQHLRSNVLVSTVPGKVIYTVAHPIDALRELFGVTEAGTRIGEFGPALKEGERRFGKGSKDAAIFALNAAQDVTTNFSRHGNIGKVLNQGIPFFNAAIQGPDKILRTFRERPLETTLTAVIGLTVPAVMLWWIAKDEQWYKDLPIHERVNYIHFRIPGTDTIIRIPVPFELGHIFQTAPVAALDAQYRKDPKIVTEMFKQSVRDANPFDIPATFRPAIDVMTNKDFAGRPIVPKSVEFKLPEDQYTEFTTDLMKILGKQLGKSPAQLEHLVKSYSGGLYTRVARTIDLKNKKEITLSDMPVLGTLFLRESYAPRAQLNRFYETRDLLNRKFSSKKITDAEKRKRKDYNSIGENLSTLWQRIPGAKTQQEKKKVYSDMRGQLDKLAKRY